MAQAATVTKLKDVAAAKKQSGFSLDDVLASATVKKEAKSSSKVPVLDVPESVKATASRLRQLKEIIENATTEFDSLSADMVEAIEPMRAELITRQGFLSSVKVPDAAGMLVGVSWSSNYSKVPLDAAASIIEAIGDERTETFFSNELVITVKKDVSQDGLKDLIASVGPERFAQFFDVERWLKPTKRYTEEWYSAFTEEERAALSPIVRQYEPSIKVR